MRGASYRFPNRRTAGTTSKRGCACMTIPMARLAFSTGRASSSALRPAQPPKRRTPQPAQHRPVLAALKAKPCGRRWRAGLDRRSARAVPESARRDEETHPPLNQETGHLPCYQIRTSVRVIDTAVTAFKSLFALIARANEKSVDHSL